MSCHHKENIIFSFFSFYCIYMTRNLYAGQETCMQVKKQHLEPDMEQQTDSK